MTTQPQSPPAKCYCPPNLVRHSNYEPCTTRPPQSPPAGDELENLNTILLPLLTEMAEHPDISHTDTYFATKAQLNAYILAQVLELIGPDVPMLPTALKGQVEAGNRVRAELRRAAQARFGGEEGE